MRLYAYAKINWTLDILSRLENGYHEMDMLMQPISLRDELTIDKSDALTLTVTGNVSVPSNEDNLCLKAARALARIAGGAYGASITLQKHIPIGAGLGGGSADCAAVLVGLNRLWQLHLSLGELADIALPLGADVPACLYDGLKRATGIGEKLTLYSAPKRYHLIVIKPQKPLSTKLVFSAFDINSIQNRPHNGNALKAIQTGDFMLLRASLGNVLTPISKELCEEVASALFALDRYGAALSFMTGSGNAVVGVYKSPEARDGALQALQAAFTCYAARTTEKSVEMSL